MGLPSFSAAFDAGRQSVDFNMNDDNNDAINEDCLESSMFLLNFDFFDEKQERIGVGALKDANCDDVCDEGYCESSHGFACDSTFHFGHAESSSQLIYEELMPLETESHQLLPQHSIQQSPSRSSKKSSKSLKSSRTGKGNQVCPYCGKSFSCKSQLSEHILYRHNSERRHVCAQCGKSFKSRSNLNQHSRTHENRKRVCEFCKKQFASDSGHRYHMLTCHNDSLRFNCTLCDKSFVQNKLLQRHILASHCEERKFACPHCDFVFKRKDHLHRHVTDTHSIVEKLFECNQCKKRFQSARTLSQHRKIHKNDTRFHES